MRVTYFLTTTDAIVVEFEAWTREGTGVYGVQAGVWFATSAQAEAFAAQFPKSLRLKVGSISGGNAPKDATGVRFSADLRASGNHGAVNETGIKRYRAFRKALAKLGVEVALQTYPILPREANTVQSFEELHAEMDAALPVVEVAKAAKAAKAPAVAVGGTSGLAPVGDVVLFHVEPTLFA